MHGRSHLSLILIVVPFFLSAALAQQQTPTKSTATCDFDADKQLAVEYLPFSVAAKKPVFGHQVPYDEVWAPGGKPLTLFVNSPVSIGQANLPLGAYTMFVIPDEKHWSLVISKSTDTSGKYDASKDLARVRMEYGELPSAENQFSVYFAHVAPKQCNMRIDLAKSRAWVAFQEK